MYKQRIEKMKQLAKNKGIDFVCVIPGANMFYLTGLDMHLSERPTIAIIPAEGEMFFYCPGFEVNKIRKVTGVEKVVTYTDEEGPYKAMQEWAAARNMNEAVVAFDYRSARLLDYMVVNQAVSNCELVDARPLIASLRMHKDSAELKIMDRAAELADIMIQAIRDALVPGISETELRKVAIDAVNKAEPEAAEAFITVASGPRAALPHAGDSDRIVQAGELVIVDLGAAYKGYCSDITRTLPVGEISEEHKNIYEIVRQANEKGKEAAKPGVTCEEVDRVTREFIEQQGYGQYFTHRTGHGLGIEVHEEPYIVEGNKTVLEEGMTFTIEPGIYIAGKVGVRIEDDVVITKDGCRSLTKYPREIVY